MIMKRIILCLIVGLFVISVSHAQSDREKTVKSVEEKTIDKSTDTTLMSKPPQSLRKKRPSQNITSSHVRYEAADTTRKRTPNPHKPQQDMESPEFRVRVRNDTDQ
jgi:hypothetical protein